MRLGVVVPVVLFLVSAASADFPVRGRVVGENAAPLSGAIVELRPLTSSFDDGVVTPLSTTRADDTGSFELQVPGGKRFQVVVSAPGRLSIQCDLGPLVEPVELPLVKLLQREDLGVHLEPGERIVGRVVDQDGRPVEGVVVYAAPKSSQSRWRGPMEGQAETDAEGRFVIEDRSPGEILTLSASSPGYLRAAAQGLEVPLFEDITLVLEKLVIVRGQVVDSQGSPVPEAMVGFASTSVLGGSRGQSGPSDDDGRFEYEVDPGQLVLDASNGTGRAQMQLEVAPGEVVDDLRLVLEPSPVLEGQVLGPSGEPMASVWVHIYQDSLQGTRKKELTDSEGRFRLIGLEKGWLSLKVEAPARPGLSRDVDLKPGVNQIEVRFEGGYEVAGWVVDDNGHGLAGAELRMGSANNIQGNVSTDDSGAFLFENMPDGSYNLSAWKAGYVQLDPGEVEIQGAPVHQLEIHLSLGGAVVGRILGIDPQRTAEVRVRAFIDSGLDQIGRVDFEGRYRVEFLAPGEWAVEALHLPTGRRARGQVVLDSGAESVLDLELIEGLTLSGLITVDDEALAKPMRVRLRGLDVYGQEQAVTDYRGRFRFVGLAAGRYRVELASGPAFVHSREIDLDADLDLEFALATGR